MVTSHPDVEALAFFAEELLKPDEERTIASHVETCAACATTLDELTGVTDALVAAPVPAMPQDVADLLDQRIAEAVRERAAKAPGPGTGKAPETAGPQTEDSGARVVPISRKRKDTVGISMSRLMMVAAAAVVVGGGGAAVFNGVLSVNQDGLEDVAAPLQETEEEAAPDTAQSYTPQVVRSGKVYTDTSLSEQAARTLGGSPVGGAPEDGDTEPMDLVEDAPAGVEECVALLGDELGTRFVLVDDAYYGDEASRAWVLFAPEGEAFEVYVVDPRCAQGGDTPQSVLAQGTVQAH